MSGFPPTAGLRGGPRFGVLGLAFGSGTGGTAKTGSFQSSGKAQINALPPARTVLVAARFSSRASIADLASANSNKTAVSTLSGKASSSALPTVARFASSRIQGSARLADLASTNSNKTAVSNLSGKASSSALPTVARFASSRIQGLSLIHI